MNQSGLFHPPEGEDDKHAYHSTLEKKFTNVLTPFQQYIETQTIASFLLFSCTIVALIWASLPAISSSYFDFVHTQLGFSISTFSIEKPLRVFVNDFLLTLFFFFVGLEIKREFLVGELTNRRRAIYIVFCALGGMVIPAAIYFFMNYATPEQHAWGIPMATDTAFALGILSCFKRKLPTGIFTFLAALAIIDDVGAILVIAFFYTENLNVNMLFISTLLAGVMFIINIAGFRKPLLYVVIGLLIWGFIEAANIHGTIAGIMVAFLIPARPEKGPKQFLKKTRELLKKFENQKQKNPHVLEDEEQHIILEDVNELSIQATTPLQRWESNLELPIILIVLPVFALVNAGIQINYQLIDDIFTHTVSLGILLGLLVGKPIGVMLFGQLSLWLNLGRPLEDISSSQLFTAAILTGIGFTMSLFITNLSFDHNTQALLLAKGAVLFASLFAGILGIILLIFCRNAHAN